MCECFAAGNPFRLERSLRQHGAIHLVADRFDFDAPRNTMAFVCERVRDGAPVLFVSHDDDGEWQFLCGGDHSRPAEGDRGVLFCLECVVARDPSLNDVAELGLGRCAARDEVGGEWDAFDHPSADDE
jgi:hypothetical protein